MVADISVEWRVLVHLLRVDAQVQPAVAAAARLRVEPFQGIRKAHTNLSLTPRPMGRKRGEWGGICRETPELEGI